MMIQKARKRKISLYIFKFFKILKSLFYPLNVDQNKIQRDRKVENFSSFIYFLSINLIYFLSIFDEYINKGMKF